MFDCMGYPKIKQFNDMVYTAKARHDYVGKAEDGSALYEHTSPYPTLLCTGTVKVHGTNAGIAFDHGEYCAQGRHRYLSPNDDNAGFASFVQQLTPAVLQILGDLAGDQAVLYGEWCGSKIQKGTAINQVSRRFILFDIRKVLWGSSEGAHWADMQELRILTSALTTLNEAGIFIVTQATTYQAVVDLNHPRIAADYFETVVASVEEQCPIGTLFGAMGPGEGIVWTAACPETGGRLVFKTKGEKHRTRNTREAIPVDPEVVASVSAFVETTVTEVRLQQGKGYLAEHGMRCSQEHTGPFLKWVCSDVISEERLSLEASGLVWRDVQRAMSKAAQRWWANEAAQELYYETED